MVPTGQRSGSWRNGRRASRRADKKGGKGKRTHPDVQAAAAKNIARVGG